jgi:hypothetical protein
MKKIQSLLSSLALLFSLPFLAAPLAAKSIESKGPKNESQEQIIRDEIRVEQGPRIYENVPPCRGGGGS